MDGVALEWETPDATGVERGVSTDSISEGVFACSASRARGLARAQAAMSISMVPGPARRA